jgi:hypothetical protein
MHMRACWSFLFVLAAAFGHRAMAQTGPEQHTHLADRYYQRMAYAQALQEYTKAADLGALNEHVVKRAAECAVKLGDTRAGETWYEQVVKFLNRTPDDLFMYAQMLKSNGKYAEAEAWMDRYLAAKQGRATSISNLQDFVRKFTSSPDRFSVTSVSINSDKSDLCPAWATDGRVIFCSARDSAVGMQWRSAWTDEPFLDLHSAQRQSNGDLTGARKLTGSANSRLHDGPACMAPDGSLWFTRTNGTRSTNGVQRLGIFHARPDRDGWTGHEPFLYNNPECSVGHPAISPDGRSIYFMSDMPGGFGGTDLYMCRDAGGRWGEPKNLGPGINTDRNELFPFLAQDGSLWFSSNGLPGLGGLDLFVAKPGVDGSFDFAVNAGAPVNGASDDFGLIIDPAGKTGYFSSNRPGGRGADDIYAFVMHRPVEQRYLCTGTVVDDEQAAPLAQADVQLLDADGTVLAAASTGADGRYAFPVEARRRYTIRVRATGHYDGLAHLQTNDIERTQILARDIHLVPDAGIWLRGTVYYKADSSLAEGVDVSVVNLTSFFSEKHASDAGGDFLFRLQPNETFEVVLEKPGHFNMSVPVSTLGVKQGVIELGEVRDLMMERVVPGEPMPLRHVVWKAGELLLSPTAKAELDRLAERLQVNPDMTVEIGVHANTAADPAKALVTTGKRANEAVAYLRSKGVPKAKLSAKGYGVTKPRNDCGPGVPCSEEQRAVNERVEYTVTAISGS